MNQISITYDARRTGHVATVVNELGFLRDGCDMTLLDEILKLPEAVADGKGHVLIPDTPAHRLLVQTALRA